MYRREDEMEMPGQKSLRRSGNEPRWGNGEWGNVGGRGQGSKKIFIAVDVFVVVVLVCREVSLLKSCLSELA